MSFEKFLLFLRRLPRIFHHIRSLVLLLTESEEEDVDRFIKELDDAIDRMSQDKVARRNAARDLARLISEL